jgi:DNA polymerase-3 subunit chi
MTDIQFYYLSAPLERVLPKLLEKSLAGGFRARVKFASEEKAENMNTLLWTYNPDAFLPHGTAKDGYGEQQPVYLTAADDNPNRADLIVITDGSKIEEDAGVKRVLDLVESADEAALGSADERQRAYAAQGHSVSCVRQTASGGWEKQHAG